MTSATRPCLLDRVLRVIDEACLYLHPMLAVRLCGFGRHQRSLSVVSGVRRVAHAFGSVTLLHLRAAVLAHIAAMSTR